MAAAVRALACAALGLLAFPPAAAAQHETFIEALADFTAALSGTYGDEGAGARDALDRLERGLREWDATLLEYEGNVAEIRPTASPGRVLEMHRTMGMFYLARGRHQDAVREFDAAVAAEPGEPLFHLFRGLALEAAGRRADAVAAYGRAARIDAEDPVAAYMVSAAGFADGSSQPPPAALATLSTIVDGIATGQYTPELEPFLATTLVPDGLSDTPRFVPALYAAAYALLDRAEYGKAVAAMRAAAADDPLLAPPAAAGLLEGSRALREGRVADAIERFGAAAAQAPGSEAHRLLGVAYWLDADHERSIEHLEQAIRLRPTDERARLALVRILDEIGDTVRTERVLVETVEAIPSSALARWRLGRMYSMSNRTEDALREYEAAVRIGVLTGEAPLLLSIGELHRREFDTERAEAAFARAAALRPNDGVAHRERGRSLLQLDRADEAFVELAAALMLDPKDYESCLTIGQLHLEAERYAAAARVLTHAVAVEPEKPEAYYALATTLARDGRRDEAAPHLETFTRLQARTFEQERRRMELSTSRLEAAVLAERGDFGRAVELWTRTVTEEPEAPGNHAGLASALEGLGRFEAAAAAYEQAITLGASPLVFRQLASLYEKMGRPDASARTRARLARGQQDAFTGSTESDGR